MIYLYEYQRQAWQKMVDDAKVAIQSDCPLIEDETLVAIDRVLYITEERVEHLCQLLLETADFLDLHTNFHVYAETLRMGVK